MSPVLEAFPQLHLKATNTTTTQITSHDATQKVNAERDGPLIAHRTRPIRKLVRWGALFEFAFARKLSKPTETGQWTKGDRTTKRGTGTCVKCASILSWPVDLCKIYINLKRKKKKRKWYHRCDFVVVEVS